MAALLALVGLLFLAAALHPFLTYPVSLFVLKRREVHPVVPVPIAFRPRIALCMCAYNEERVIVAKMERLLAMAAAYGPATIHVYADGPSDGTAELLRPYADRVDLVLSTERLGKTAGMNTLVARSDSELIAFTDANVVTPVDGLIGLSEPFADPAIGCATAKLVYSNDDETPTAQAGSVYWRVEEALKRIESDTVGVIGADGAFFMIRRALHEPPPPSLIDDLYVSLAVLMRGARVVSVDHIIVQERSATHWTEEMRRKQRIACQAMNVHRALWPRLRAMRPLTLYAYVSHRLLKWLSPFLLLGAAAMLSLAFAWRLGPLALLIAWAAAALLALVGGLLRIPPVPMALSSATSLYGVGAGVLQSLFARRTYVTWQPAESVREIE